MILAHVLFPTKIAGIDVAPGCDTNAVAIDGIGDIVVAVRSESDFNERCAALRDTGLQS
jgi:hypothetical protein